MLHFIKTVVLPFFHGIKLGIYLQSNELISSVDQFKGNETQVGKMVCSRFAFLMFTQKCPILFNGAY